MYQIRTITMRIRVKNPTALIQTAVNLAYNSGEDASGINDVDSALTRIVDFPALVSAELIGFEIV